MAVNKTLALRPIKNVNKEVLANPDEMERLWRWTGDTIDELDRRRIAQQAEVETGATDADTIVNLVAAVNALIAALNNSQLTED